MLIRFEGYTGRYVYHCHMLEHEDNDMMRPYRGGLQRLNNRLVRKTRSTGRSLGVQGL